MRGSATISPAVALLGAGRLHVNLWRPFRDRNGGSFVYRQNADGSHIKVHANTPATLQYDEWRDIDRVVVEAAVQRMVGVMDLKGRGLVHGLGSLGFTISTWDAQSDMTPADIDMSGVTGGEKDTLGFRPSSVPVPVIHKDFQLEMRRLEASRLFGSGLDTDAAETAARRVAEAAETMLFQGASIVVPDATTTGGQARIFGYLNHPDRNLVDINQPWDELQADLGENFQIIEDVLAMIEAARNARHYGPFVLYVPKNYERKLDEDYRGPDSSDTRTVFERLKAIREISDVKVADFLPDDNVVLVSMNRGVVDWAEAQDVTTVQWTVTGGMVQEYKVMLVGVPRIKSDYDGRCGIVHAAPFPS